MQYLEKAFKSRTVWTIALVFVIGGLQATQDFMSPQMFMMVNSGLLALAAHFRINTKANLK